MKESYTELYPNEQVAKNVGDYSAAHSTPLPSYITAYHAKGSEHKQSNYMISPFQAQFQVWFAKAFEAKRSKFSAFTFPSLIIMPQFQRWAKHRSIAQSSVVTWFISPCSIPEYCWKNTSD
jgi:hypothetical protein